MHNKVTHHEGWTLCSERSLDGQMLQLYEKQDAALDAPALGLVHGMEEGWDVWLPAGCQLSDRFRTLCVDLPWHGRNGYQWGYERSAAEWLHEALQLMPTPPVALIAHSFGANTVLDYLQRYQIPTLRAAVLVSPLYKAQYEDLDWKLFHDAIDIFRSTMEQGLRVRQCISGRSEPSLLPAMTDIVVRKVGPLGFMEFFNLLSRTPALQLDRVCVPVLVVAGVNDLAFTLMSDDSLVQALPEGSVELIPDCGHFCMLEKPDVFAQLARQFLAQQIY